MSNVFLIWAVERAQHHAGDYLIPEVRLCLERTLDLLRAGGEVASEQQEQERLFLALPAATDGMSWDALAVSWAALVRAGRKPRVTLLEQTLASLAQVARLRQLQGELRGRRDLSPAAAERALQSRREQITRRARDAFHEELALIERMKVGERPTY